MDSYYERLSAERLERCYEIAPPGVKAYLDLEGEYVCASMASGARVLELGCGYGRVLAALARKSGWLAGVDLSLSSLALARRRVPGAALAQMNVAALSFRPASFDLVCCPQNGISAFHVDQRALLASALRLVTPGGQAQFFSYADAFWPHRLAWFRIQAAEGLIGEIDEAATADGTIVCKDGFTATTVSPDRFRELTQGLGTSVSVSVLGEASVVCTITA